MIADFPVFILEVYTGLRTSTRQSWKFLQWLDADSARIFKWIRLIHLRPFLSHLPYQHVILASVHPQFVNLFCVLHSWNTFWPSLMIFYRHIGMLWTRIRTQTPLVSWLSPLWTLDNLEHSISFYTFWNSWMIFGKYTRQIKQMCCVHEWKLWLSYFFFFW